ncbi:hypothetical protein IE4872_PD01986 (plasmid) [Rhizobium gallicum]|uniref:Uncharacterized protein n=1 Tax=Rhizobium gallicum TaxID=56730 RepID=A0A1L5NX59_9HYPH|nr:hypothetical protein IE4872_PD01986 [Rhizobium gallicum]
MVERRDISIHLDRQDGRHPPNLRSRASISLQNRTHRRGEREAVVFAATAMAETRMLHKAFLATMTLMRL